MTYIPSNKKLEQKFSTKARIESRRCATIIIRNFETRMRFLGKKKNQTGMKCGLDNNRVAVWLANLKSLGSINLLTVSKLALIAECTVQDLLDPKATNLTKESKDERKTNDNEFKP